ncbi:DUF899 family protein [Nonomuraea turkmeniaca]|uniref:DUF899 family protein n=1 Tax=Nonomuraea turkmeniaca TaxID=103838 RepID=UPI001B886302
MLLVRHGSGTALAKAAASAPSSGGEADVFHVYSTYARGADLLNSTFNYLDLTALGRPDTAGRQPAAGGGGDPTNTSKRNHRPRDPRTHR